MKNLKFIIISACVFLTQAQLTIASKENISQTTINKENISKLFPKTTHEIKTLASDFVLETQEKIKDIVSIKPEDKTFENTIKAFDKLVSISNLAIFLNCIRLLEKLSPEKEIRNTVGEEILKIQNFLIEKISNNQDLYKAIKDYSQNNTQITNLSPEQQYFIKETLQNYKRAGLDLPAEKQEEIKKLNKELAELELQFRTNVAQSNKTITVSRQELAGLDQEFIDSLKKDNKSGENSQFIVGTDYPTYFNVMDNCDIESTREKLYMAFNNKAYPENKEILEKIIKARDKLAKSLGFENYAHLDLSNQMAKNPETVKNFIESLYQRAENKTLKEFDLLKANLPESVTLSRDSKIKNWDLKYIKNCYKKKYLKLDEQEIAQYFPTEKTIKALLNIYEQFFGLKFIVSSTKDLIHPDIKLIEIYENRKNNSNRLNVLNELIGLLILDLYPRDNKYGHACEETIIPAVKNSGPCVCAVITNFPKETPNRPALMNHSDVKTFAHELGHALHAILGRTDIGSFSGANVKMDFVEMPSQMLEQWIDNKEILKKISCHYKTGEPLSDQLIEKIIQVKNFSSGNFTQGQCFFSSLSLEYFNGNNIGKTPQEIQQEIASKMLKNIETGNNNNMYASFGHIATSDYGSKYYCYQWANVFTLDMFSKIKAQGLLNPIAGLEYKEKVLAPGGSVDPNILLRNFLGREPNQDAFFEDMGI